MKVFPILCLSLPNNFAKSTRSKALVKSRKQEKTGEMKTEWTIIRRGIS